MRKILSKLLLVALLCAASTFAAQRTIKPKWEHMRIVAGCQLQNYWIGQTYWGRIQKCSEAGWEAYLPGSGGGGVYFDSAKIARKYVEHPYPLQADLPWPNCNQPWPPPPPNCPESN